MNEKGGILGPLLPFLKLPVLKAEQQRELSKRILKTGDPEAVDTLVKHNIRLAVNMAKKFLGQTDLELEDLIQEGILGLMRAAKDFDCRKARFSTYATYWIKQTIKRAIHDSGGTVRVPVHAQEQWWKIRKIIHEFQDEFGREPNEKEIAESLDLGIKKTRAALLVMRTAPNNNAFLRLDSCIENQDGDGDFNSDLKELIPDWQLTPEQFVEVKDELKSALRRIEDIKNYLRGCKVSERNIKVLSDTFGLDGSFELKTLE